jgi:hypothetical protein
MLLINSMIVVESGEGWTDAKIGKQHGSEEAVIYKGVA